MSLELRDWANNSVIETWAALDTTAPVVEWSINPHSDLNFSTIGKVFRGLRLKKHTPLSQ